MNDIREPESFPPPPNLPPGDTFGGKMRFASRIFLDLMVASVVQRLAPWLRSRAGGVLEVGCGAQPYRHFIPASCKYRGLDWAKSREAFGYEAPDTTYYEGGEFPFDDGVFDNVFHTEVMEHIYKKEQFLKECHRVLKPGGELFFAVPFQARYHYIPHDYWRFTPAALDRMLREAGFGEIKITPRGNDITVAAYKAVSVAYRWLRSGIAGAVTGILVSPLALASLVIAHLSLKISFGGSADDCLGYVVTARKR